MLRVDAGEKVHNSLSAYIHVRTWHIYSYKNVTPLDSKKKVL